MIGTLVSAAGDDSTPSSFASSIVAVVAALVTLAAGVSGTLMVSRRELSEQRRIERQRADSSPPVPVDSTRDDGLAVITHPEGESSDHERELDYSHRASTQRVSTMAFIISFAMGTIGFLIILLGVAVGFSQGIEVGLVTGLAGAIPEVAAPLLFTRADAAAKRAHENFAASSARRDEHLRWVESWRSACEITDERLRERTKAILALRRQYPDTPPSEILKLLDGETDSSDQ